MSTRPESGSNGASLGLQVAVVGGSEASLALLAEAERVGAALAASGSVLVCGGLGGIMEAAARGAFLAGGFTLGILPGRSRDAANRYLTCAVATGLGHFRNFLVVSTADAVIAFPGRHGTLSEIAMALTLGKPVVGLGSWDVDGVARATSPEDAVRQAIDRASASPRHGARARG
jgi:uncharacterized protein (TIGR00725 family)